jgi:hypothetical protein
MIVVNVLKPILVLVVNKISKVKVASISHLIFSIDVHTLDYAFDLVNDVMK